jgi:hypothetical protein
MNSHLILKNFCLNLKNFCLIQMNPRLNLKKNYEKVSSFRHLNLMMNCVQVLSSCHLSVKVLVNCCAEELCTNLNVQVVSWYYYVVPGKFDLIAKELIECYLAWNTCG